MSLTRRRRFSQARRLTGPTRRRISTRTLATRWRRTTTPPTSPHHTPTTPDSRSSPTGLQSGPPSRPLSKVRVGEVRIGPPPQHPSGVCVGEIQIGPPFTSNLSSPPPHPLSEVRVCETFVWTTSSTSHFYKVCFLVILEILIVIYKVISKSTLVTYIWLQ